MDRKDFVLATLLQCTEQDIDDYKRWLGLPSHLAQNGTYRASNVLEWIKLDKFNDYLEHQAQDTRPDASSRVDTDIIEISDSEPATSPVKRAAIPDAVDRKPVLREILNLCTSESDSEACAAPIKLEIKQEPSVRSHAPPSGRFHKAEQIRITRSEKVDRVEILSEVPDRWPVSDVDTAYILDFSSDDRAKKETRGGKPKGLDAFLKAEDQDSWGKGTNGSTSRPTALAILGGIPSRRSIHKCNGGHKCEFFDPALLADYQRIDGADMSLTQEIFLRELDQNRTDSGSAAGRAASFLRVIQRFKKSGCPKPGYTGVPVLKKLRGGPSKDAKLRFIGCTKWIKAEEWKHTYASIPADVDEDILSTYLDGSALPPADVEAHEASNGHCARFSHPRHGKQTDCPHVHLQEGKIVTGKMVPHECPATKIVYTSKDPKKTPTFKTGYAAKEDVKRCVAAGGTLGETGGHVNRSHATQAILGTSLDVKHPAFRDTRRLRDEVGKLKSDGTPAGLLWAGILEDHANDLKLPLEERYVHHIRMDGDTKIAVVMSEKSNPSYKRGT
ncbi:hypothetical protein C8R43DRAFT_1139479 [Mycena crocata]|nr:hypothetical protein C8R43DRAFT_1139479 [Mycena crocata]